MVFMAENSSPPGTARSNEVRAELDEPCTRNSTGSGLSPGFGAPTRLRQRLSLVPPLLAQYSALQISPSVVVVAAEARRDTRLIPAPIRTVRRATSMPSIARSEG